MFSFFVFCVICSWVGWWRNGIVEKIQEKLPENGDFMAFLHRLFPNFNVCKMLTINAEIKKEEQRSDKTYNVKLRFTLGRKFKRVSTSLFVTPKDLTKDFKIKQSSPICRVVNELIRSYEEKCAKLQIEQNGYTIDDVMDCLNGEQAQHQMIDFIKFCREWISNADIKGAPNYTSAVNALVRFIGKDTLDVKLITTDFLERFKDFLNYKRKEREKQLAEQGKRIPSNRALSLYLMSIAPYLLRAENWLAGVSFHSCGR